MKIVLGWLENSGEQSLELRLKKDLIVYTFSLFSSHNFLLNLENVRIIEEASKICLLYAGKLETAHKASNFHSFLQRLGFQLPVFSLFRENMVEDCRLLIATHVMNCVEADFLKTALKGCKPTIRYFLQGEIERQVETNFDDVIFVDACLHSFDDHFQAACQIICDNILGEIRKFLSHKSGEVASEPEILQEYALELLTEKIYDNIQFSKSNARWHQKIQSMFSDVLGGTLQFPEIEIPNDELSSWSDFEDLDLIYEAVIDGSESKAGDRQELMKIIKVAKILEKIENKKVIFKTIRGVDFEVHVDASQLELATPLRIKDYLGMSSLNYWQKKEKALKFGIAEERPQDEMRKLQTWKPSDCDVPSNFDKAIRLQTKDNFQFVQADSEFTEMMPKLAASNVIAIDFEYHDDHSYLGMISLIQLSTYEWDFFVDSFSLFSRINKYLKVILQDGLIIKTTTPSREGSHLCVSGRPRTNRIFYLMNEKVGYNGIIAYEEGSHLCSAKARKPYLGVQ
ncbi:unnamed protein product [Allacma fusca]|uniref:3'-5' exonuclease domain-containing protein n=1 Tax=Allacma fusca TaxID=39272 RepID=A0A8J2KTC8_9HEXA|nr:unnamed protein product [Allacma fusca]